jgi:hypothetical protein
MNEGRITDAEQPPREGEDVAGPQQPAWMKAFGGLRNLKQETRRIQGIIDKEFGQIDEEDWLRVSMRPSLGWLLLQVRIPV